MVYQCAWWRNHLNQDFAIVPTPAIARKIIQASKIIKADIDSRIIEIAKNDLITTEMFDPLFVPTEQQLKAVQFLIDSDFRAVMPRGDFITPVLLMEAINLKQHTPITVAISSGSSRRSWEDLLEGYKIDSFVDTYYNIYELLTNPKFKPQDGVLILEWGYANPEGLSIRKALAKEFPKTIIYTLISETSERRLDYSSLLSAHRHRQRNSDIEGKAIWWDLAEVLYPMMSTQVFDGAMKDSPDRDKMAFFYNVFLPKFHIDNVGVST